jgi:hypothetical protein
MRSIFMTHAKLSTTCYLIQISMGSLIICHSRNLEMESISGEILCPEIGHGDKQYIAMKIIFNSNIWYYFKG